MDKGWVLQGNGATHCEHCAQVHQRDLCATTHQGAPATPCFQGTQRAVDARLYNPFLLSDQNASIQSARGFRRQRALAAYCHNCGRGGRLKRRHGLLAAAVNSLLQQPFFYQTVSFELLSPSTNTLGLWVILVPVGGGLIIGLLARFGSEQICGHGIPDAIEAILFKKSKMSPKIALLKPLSSGIAIGSGGPFSAEGPIIMAVMFALELTHDVQSLLPLLTASAVAYGFTVVFMPRPVLTEKIARRGYHIYREYGVDPLERYTVQDVMAQSVETIEAQMSIYDALILYFGEQQTRRAFPVVKDGVFVGMVDRDHPAGRTARSRLN